MWEWLLHTDKTLFLWLNGDGGCVADTFFYYVSGKLTWIPLYLAILFFIRKRYGTRTMLWALLFLGLTVVAADQTANLFKNTVERLRPTHTPGLESLVHTVRNYRGGDYGTVSAHAAISFSIATFTALLFRRRWYGWAIFCWALLISYSRIYLGVHFPSDVLFGGGLGCLLGFVSFRLFSKWVR